MALLRRKSTGDVHWSKDYIEHLRSVHFVLVVVAVTCIAVSRGPDITLLKSAQSQIHAIIDVVAAVKVDAEREVFFDDEFEPWLTAEVDNKRYFAHANHHIIALTLCSNERMEYDNWVSMLSTPIRSENVSLAKFQLVWDLAACDDTTWSVIVHDFATTPREGKGVVTQQFGTKRNFRRNSIATRLFILHWTQLTRLSTRRS